MTDTKNLSDMTASQLIAGVAINAYDLQPANGPKHETYSTYVKVGEEGFLVELHDAYGKTFAEVAVLNPQTYVYRLVKETTPVLTEGKTAFRAMFGPVTPVT